MTERLTLRELGRRLGRDASGLGRLARKGQIPKGSDSKFDEAAVRKALATSTDPARSKPLPSRPQSTSTVYARPERGTYPDPAAYRTRADISDDFTRGALYGAHLVAFGAPTAAASGAIEAGADPALAAALHDAVAAEAPFLVNDVTAALGLTPPGVEDAGPHAPTAFGGFTPFGDTSR